MTSSKKGGEKNSGKFPSTVDHKPMVQGLGEMKLNVSDSDDWLVINKENRVRARKNQQNSPNPPPKAWGQPAMLGRPRSYDQVSWGNIHTPTAGFVSRPPNFVNNNHNGVGMGPSWSDGQSFSGRGGYDGTRPKNGGCKLPCIVIDSTDDEEEEEEEKEEEEEEEEDDDSSKKSKHVSKNKAPTKNVPQNVTSDPWGHPGAVSRPYKSRDHAPSGGLHPGFGNYGWGPTSVAPNPYMSRGPAPSDVLHPGFGNYGWRPNGVVPRPNMSGDHAPTDVYHPGFGNYGWRPAGRGFYVPPAICPPPLSRCGGNSAAAEMKKNFKKKGKSISKVNSYEALNITEDDDDAWSDEDDVTQKTSSNQIGHSIHGQVGADQRRVMPIKLNHIGNLANGVGYSQTQAARPVGKISGYTGFVSASEHFHKNLCTVEVKRQKDLKNPCTREGILPGSSNPTSRATSCKTSVKNGGQEVGNFSETESSEFDDEEEEPEFEDNEFDDVVSRPVGESVRGTSENSGKKVERNFVVKQASKLPKDDKKEVQCRKHQKEESGEGTDVYAGDYPQLETKKVAELPNAHVSVLEEYKNRVKEMAKLVKFHIMPKQEVDTCVAEREQLMKIHEEKLEMKKRHQEEEQELEKQFAVALKRFVEKRTAVNSDADASCEL